MIVFGSILTALGALVSGLGLYLRFNPDSYWYSTAWDWLIRLLGRDLFLGFAAWGFLPGLCLLAAGIALVVLALRRSREAAVLPEPEPEPIPQGPTWSCGCCGMLNSTSEQLCVRCGASRMDPEKPVLRNPEVRCCPGCGAALKRENQRFCFACGLALQTDPQSDSPLS